MAKKRKARRDRYDVSGNVEAQYVDEAPTVLVNKLGITDLLAVQTARPPLAYDSSPAGVDAYMAGAKAAFKRDYAPLATLIAAALARSR